MTFPYPEHEEYLKLCLIRYPEYIEELQDYLKHHKDEIFTCKGCQTSPDPMPLHTGNSSYLLLDEADSDQVTSPTTSTMSNLLPELLLEIFRILSWEDPPYIRETWDTSETKILATPHLGWIHVTHVCRRWRHLGIQTAALWANVGHGLGLGSSWTEEFLSRAKGANVSIPQFDDYPWSIERISDYIQNHPSHIRNVTLSADSTSMQLIWAFCDFYLPMTVSANLDAGRYNWHNAVLFEGYAPNLKYLRLCNIVPWTAHTFLENLIELDVFICDDLGTSKNQNVITLTGDFDPVDLFIFPPLSQVFDVLDEASNLRHLSLHYAIPPEDDSVDESRKVRFPFLKSFSMSSKVRDCVSFLERLDIPPDVTLELTCMPGLSLAKFRDLFRVLARRVDSAADQCPPIERLELGAARFNDRSLIRVYGEHAEMGQNPDNRLASSRSSELSHVSPRPIITLSLAYASPQDHGVVLQDFFSSMPLQGLVYLSIYRCSTIKPEDWRSIVRDSYTQFQSVRFLVLGHDCAQFFFHAIHDGDDILSGFGPPAFPNLDRLIFRRVDFSMFDRSDVSEASFQDQMLSHLRERVRRGRPLRAVFFFSCQGIDEEWFRELEEVVKFVRLGL